MNYQPPQYLFWLLLAIAIGSAICLSCRSYKRSETRRKEKGVIGDLLIDTLTKMHRCTLRLKDKAVKQYEMLFTFSDFLELCGNVAGAMKEHKEVLQEVKKDFKRKQLSKDKVKKRQQIDLVWDKLTPIMETEWTLNRLVDLGNLLDKLPNMQNAQFEGLTKLRENDKQWNKLFHKLNNMKVEFAGTFADESLKKMINDYVDYDFGGCSLWFFIEIFNNFVPVDMQPSEFIKSGANSPEVRIENRMTKLLVDIVNKTKELEN